MLITVNPRIHLSLVSMHEGAIRRNGGVGFSISKPNVVLEIEPSAEFNYSDFRHYSFSIDEISSLKQAIENAIQKFNLTKSISVKVSGGLGTHVGLGSGTAIRLACLEALFSLNNLPFSSDDLVQISNRGGTSGIGINTYFDGGLILDLGRPTGLNNIQPSSNGRNHSLPLSIKRLEMPNWKMGLCIPQDFTPKTQAEEAAFFKNNTPISRTSSFEASYFALFGIYASVLESNFENFCESVKALQKSEWKHLERQQYGSYIQEIEDLLYRRGVSCVGMSSLGPLVYFFYQDSLHIEVDDEFKILGVEVVDCTPVNYGRKLIQ